MDKFKRDKLTAEIISISRDEARELWDEIKGEGIVDKYNSHGYRKRIERFKQFMAQGEWTLFYNPKTRQGIKFVHDPIIFDKEGEVFEGKHRIIALSEQEENINIPFLAIMGFTDFKLFKQYWHLGFKIKNG